MSANSSGISRDRTKLHSVAQLSAHSHAPRNSHRNGERKPGLGQLCSLSILYETTLSVSTSTWIPSYGHPQSKPRGCQVQGNGHLWNALPRDITIWEVEGQSRTYCCTEQQNHNSRSMSEDKSCRGSQSYPKDSKPRLHTQSHTATSITLRQHDKG